MPAIGTITLNGLSGADHVFAPFGVDPKNVATFLKAGTSPVADEKLTVSVTRLPNNGKIRTLLKLTIPKVQDVDVGGVTRPTVVRTINVVCELSSDATSTESERTEAMTLLLSALNTDDAPTVMPTFLKAQPYF